VQHCLHDTAYTHLGGAILDCRAQSKGGGLLTEAGDKKEGVR